MNNSNQQKKLLSIEYLSTYENKGLLIVKDPNIIYVPCFMIKSVTKEE